MYTGASLSFGLIRACRRGLVLYCSVLPDAGGENDGSSAIFERSHVVRAAHRWGKIFVKWDYYSPGKIRLPLCQKSISAGYGLINNMDTLATQRLPLHIKAKQNCVHTLSWLWGSLSVYSKTLPKWMPSLTLNTFISTKIVGKRINLTHCGLVTPYGDTDLGQHWFR